MAKIEWLRLKTAAGHEVVLDLGQILACWEGKTVGHTVLEFFGRDDVIEIVADFDTFVREFFTVYDVRPKEKKPRRKKRQGSSTPIITSASRGGSAKVVILPLRKVDF